jgi:ATP-binding cassette subfamily C protein
VVLDGAGLEQWPVAGLGRHIGFLPQDIQLFDGTIAENISRFEADADPEAVRKAASAAGLHGTIFLEHGQYLHLGFDLQLGSGPSWSLRELRKIRYNEKNYFDHPGFGVIAIVSPVRVTG